MAALEQLKENAKEFWSEAQGSFDKGKWNAAATLFYKTLTCMADFMIYERSNELPKNHTERFKILELNFDYAYRICSNLFSTYIKTYDLKVTKPEAEKIKEGVLQIVKHYKIEFIS